MAVMTITYEAKCKHCKNIEREYKTSKAGNIYCSGHKCLAGMYGGKTTPNWSARNCEKFEL